MKFKRIIRLLAACLLVLAVGACAPYQGKAELAVPLGHRVDLNNQSAVQAKLNSQYRSWAGTPHRTGGMSKAGVDCSALVYMTYREALGYELPRTAALQSRLGISVAKSQLRPGDLVFFRTRVVAKHVGIYLGDGKFMHVSSKRGVMISGLDDYYWKDRFSDARRL